MRAECQKVGTVEGHLGGWLPWACHYTGTTSPWGPKRLNSKLCVLEEGGLCTEPHSDWRLSCRLPLAVSQLSVLPFLQAAPGRCAEGRILASTS